MYTELQFISGINIERLSIPCKVGDYNKIFDKLVKDGKPFKMVTIVTNSSFKIEDCKYKDDKQEIENRIRVMQLAIKNRLPNDNCILTLKANVNYLIENKK